MAGKRAMLIVTAGGREEHYAPRGVNGPIDDLLFPINHGILYYPGYDVLPPFVIYSVDRFDDAGFEPIAERLRERMRTLATTPPIDPPPTHPLSASEWRGLSHPEHATPPWVGRSRCGRL